MATKSKSRTTTKTKAETKADFDALASEVKSRETLTDNNRKLKTDHNDFVKSSVAGLSADLVADKLSKLGLDLSRSLMSVNEQLTNELQQLENVRAARLLEEEDLDRLYGVGTSKSALEILIQDYQEKEKELSASADAQRLSWREEQIAFAKADTERKLETEKTRKRDQEKYEYETASRHRNEEDAFAEKMRVQSVAERDRKEFLEKSWSERERVLQSREKEFNDLLLQVKNFPVQLDSEVKKATAIVGNSMKRDHEHAMALQMKDHAALVGLNEASSRNMGAENQRLLAQVADLTAKLSQASEQVQAIAREALVSAGNSRALTEITSLVEKQNSNNGSRTKA